MHRILYRLAGRFKTLIFVLGIMLIILLSFYTQSIVEKLRGQSKNIVEFYANLYSHAIAEENVDYLNFIFEQIIRKTNFPIISTDKDKNPSYWEGLALEPDDHSEDSIQKVKHMIRNMEKEFDPIEIKNPFPDTGDPILGYIYYGDSKLITQLIWLPYIEVLVVGIFILISYLGFKSIKKSEQQFIWIGMSKETAHQLGTPLSSLMGWTELLKSDIRPGNITKILPEMENDIKRLDKVAARFSQIGSKAELKKHDVTKITSEVVAYFKKRLPQMGKKIKIVENYVIKPSIHINKDLFEWVIENLIKNSLDAIEKKEGQIEIIINKTDEKSDKIYIDIKDNGKGILNQHKHLIFKPGFSTKKRGWGLGLNLSKRIIEEYHHGKLFIKDTRIGEGTCMRIII